MNRSFPLDGGATEIIRLLEEKGYEAYAVGGCVRDMLLFREPKDWDITTDAQPEQVKAVFDRTFDTGVKHGTVSVRLYGKTYEVTTYRVDGSYRDHRRPDEVFFTGNLAEDLSRRDFTVNAMAYHPKRGLIDLFEGEKDLERKLIRCVGKAEERFEEDALRMLRALRFSACLGFELDSETENAIIRKRELMAYVSCERIAEEMNKIMLCAQPERIETVWKTGLMRWCVPDFDGTDFPFESLAKTPPARTLRWAMLLQKLSPLQAADTARHLRFDNETKDGLIRLAKYREQALPTEEKAMRFFLSELGAEHFEELYTLRKALGTEDEKSLIVYQSQKEMPLAIKDLCIGGRDLLSMGLPQGKMLGHVLETLLKEVLEDPEKNRPDYLEKEAFAVVNKQEP